MSKDRDRIKEPKQPEHADTDVLLPVNVANQAVLRGRTKPRRIKHNGTPHVLLSDLIASIQDTALGMIAEREKQQRDAEARRKAADEANRGSQQAPAA